MDFIELLEAKGDGLERAICKEHRDDLLPILDPYAEIWAKYVLPEREVTLYTTYL